MFSNKWLITFALVPTSFGVLLSTLLSPSTQPIILDERETPWAMREFRFSKPQTTQIDYAKLWGAESSVFSEETVRTSWHLRGIIYEDGSHIAVLEFDDFPNRQERFQRFVVGDEITQGMTIVDVFADGIEYEVDNEKYILHIYETE